MYVLSVRQLNIFFFFKEYCLIAFIFEFFCRNGVLHQSYYQISFKRNKALLHVLLKKNKKKKQEIYKKTKK